MFTLPNLKYKYNELEPEIDTKTMEIHHSKHHQGYVNLLNNTLKDNNIQEISIRDLLFDINILDKYNDTLKNKIKNYGGGHFNHSFFWLCMSPSKTIIKHNLLQKIICDYKSVDLFKEEFNKKALELFGSGWVWLSYSEKYNKLIIGNYKNQDNPMMDNKNDVPLLCLDVWEHAYYLKYQNNRKGYVEVWWNKVNWEFVSNLYEECVINKKEISEISIEGDLIIK